MKKANIKECVLAVLYLRVSTQEQARDNHSLESQEKHCREFCKQRGWTVVEVFTDAGVSAWDDIERPGFQRMLAHIRQSHNCNLVFFDYSRFGRATERALRAFSSLDNLGVLSIASTRPDIDIRTAAGRKARRDELSDAENFSDVNSEKTALRMRSAFEDGRWCWAAPMGYQNVLGKKEHGAPNIIPDGTAPLVVRLFALVVSGNHRAADALRIVTDMGLRSKTGKKLTLHTTLKMLRNPVYIGKMRAKKWGTVQGNHKPLIDERMFKNVQLILKGKKPVAAPYNKNNPDFPLRQFVRCSECGTPLTGAPCKKKYLRYWCPKCLAVKTRHTKNMETEFFEMLKRLRPDVKMLTEFPAVLEKVWRERTADNSALLKKLKSDLQEQRQLQENLRTKWLKGVVSDKLWQEWNPSYEEKIASLQAQVEGIDSERATFQQLLEFSRSLLVDIASAWQRADIDQKQRVQNLLFPSGLFYHPEKGILNSGNDCLFNQLQDFVSGKISMARPERFELPAF